MRDTTAAGFLVPPQRHSVEGGQPPNPHRTYAKTQINRRTSDLFHPWSLQDDLEHAADKDLRVVATRPCLDERHAPCQAPCLSLEKTSRATRRAKGERGLVATDAAQPLPGDAPWRRWGREGTGGGLKCVSGGGLPFARESVF
jgi:hypothetical protein